MWGGEEGGSGSGDDLGGLILSKRGGEGEKGVGMSGGGTRWGSGVVGWEVGGVEGLNERGRVAGGIVCGNQGYAVVMAHCGLRAYGVHGVGGRLVVYLAGVGFTSF